MLDYTKVESRLKSFLKNNKRLGYSVALLVSFLINGGFSYAVETRAELRNRIVQEQENISQMLKDSDKSISDIELKIKKLTQRGEFWVKPLERSYQVAFITSFGNYTKNINISRTSSSSSRCSIFWFCKVLFCSISIFCVISKTCYKCYLIWSF